MTTLTNAKERPILFNGEMVRAILEGRKTMTRRPIQKLHPSFNYLGLDTCGLHTFTRGDLAGRTQSAYRSCPYGIVGDQLWVRETWTLQESYSPPTGSKPIAVYKASVYDEARFIWTPSIHMPRWASRILLEIASVRVERIKSITVEDIYAEGYPILASSANQFVDSWNATYPNSWDRNDWVWVIGFKQSEAGPKEIIK